MKITLPKNHILWERLEGLSPKARNAELIRLASNGHYFERFMAHYPNIDIIPASQANEVQPLSGVVNNTAGCNPQRTCNNGKEASITQEKSPLVDFGEDLFVI
jgi:hypothetical protein